MGCGDPALLNSPGKVPLPPLWSLCSPSPHPGEAQRGWGWSHTEGHQSCHGQAVHQQLVHLGGLNQHQLHQICQRIGDSASAREQMESRRSTAWDECLGWGGHKAPPCSKQWEQSQIPPSRFGSPVWCLKIILLGQNLKIAIFEPFLPCKCDRASGLAHKG